MADKKTLELQIKLAADNAAKQIKLFSQDINNAAKHSNELKISQKSLNQTTKSLQAEANRAATALKLFGGSTGDLRNAQSKMKQTVLDLIDHGLKPESVEVQNLVKQYKTLDDQLNDTEAKQDGFLGVIGKLKNEIGSLATVVAAGAFDKALGGFAHSSLEISDSFRGVKEEFGIMLGDMQAGAGLFDKLQEFNYWTPFDIEQTSQATKVLISAKVPLGEITDYLTRFGDIAQGDSQKFQSFINAFSKASAKGKADMEVLNVYIDQGVQILDVLAEQLGISTADVVDFASKGKISFEQFNQALESMAAEGGLYYNTMATAAIRLSSVQAGLEESIKTLKASIGDMLAPAITKILEAVTSIIDVINDSPLLKGVLVGIVSALAVALNSLAVKAIFAVISNSKIATVVLSAFGVSATGTAGAIGILKAALSALLGPIGLVTLAVGAVVGVYTAWKSHQQKVTEETNAAALALHEQAKSYEEVKKAAEDYMSYMNDMSLKDAEVELKRYTETILPNYQKSLENAKEKLSKTPEFVTVNKVNGRGDRTWTEEVSNPAYIEAQKAVQEAEAELTKFQAQADVAKEKIEIIKQQINDALVSFGTEWQDKLASETSKVDEQQMQSLKKLNEKAKELLGENYQEHEAYQKELAALNQYYDKKREEELEKRNEAERRRQEELQKQIESSAKTVLDWTNKNADNISKIELQRTQDRLALEKEIQNLKEKGANNEEAAMKAEKELELYYDNLIAEERQRLADNYWQNMAENAAKQQNWGNYAAASFVTQNQNTDLGQILTAIQSGKSVWEVLINIIIKCVSELESFQKAFNLITEVIKKIFTRLEPMLNKAVTIIDTIIADLADIFLPIFAIIISFLNEISKALIPVIDAIRQVLEPLLKLLINLFNEVIVPIANGLIWFGNVVIDVVNMIGSLFGIELEHLQNWDKIEMLSEDQLDNNKELTEEQEKALLKIKKQYERMEDAVQAQLNSQLDALKSQYELGLISREEYESQAEKYSAIADEKLYELEKEMNQHLKDIENNTGIVSSSITAAPNLDDGDTLVAYPSIISPDPGVQITMPYTPPSLVCDVPPDVLSQFGGLGHWDVGSYDLPQDQFGMVHKGEIIIPKTFAEGIRNGDLTLSRENKQSQSTANVTINVQGSVMAERDLITCVYDGISRAIQTKVLTPLPAGGY